MPVYIDTASRITQEHDHGLVLACPHCEATAHVTPSAVPGFAALQALKPTTIGVVYTCDACHAPVFLRYAVRAYRPDRIELASQFIEVEHPREKFSFTHLPEAVEIEFREALICFSSGAHNAFASMCRRTAQAMFADLGEAGRLKLFDDLNDVRRMADIDTQTFLAVKSVIFDTSAEGRRDPPRVDPATTAVLLEIMKDLLYEAYVRKGRIQQALMVRRYFAEETADNLTPVLAQGVASRQPGSPAPVSTP